MICKRAKVLKNGQMEVSSQEILLMERKKEMEFLSSLTGQFTKEAFILEKWKVKERKNLRTAQPMKEIGKTISNMGKESSIGLTEEITKGTFF